LLLRRILTSLEHHLQERWSYTLQGFNLSNNRKLFYAVEDDKDQVQDQLVGRVERGYWRPLRTKLPAPFAHRSDNLIVVGCDDEGEDGNEGEDDEAELASTPGRAKKRQEAAEAMSEQAKKMQRKAAEKQGFGELDVGTIVHLRKEDVDRAKLDNPCATLVVLARTETNNYIVGNKAGMYKELVARTYLTPVPNATPEQLGLSEILAKYLDDSKTQPCKRVGIRAICAAESAAGG
jgi:hypothetical protein